MMPGFDITYEEPAWRDLADRRNDIIPGPEIWKLAALEGGMESGAVSLALRLDLDGGPAGRVVVAETSLAAWIAATCALRGRFPDAFKGTPLERLDVDGSRS